MRKRDSADISKSTGQILILLAPIAFSHWITIEYILSLYIYELDLK